MEQSDKARQCLDSREWLPNMYACRLPIRPNKIPYNARVNSRLEKSKCQKYDECKLVFGTALYSVIKPTYIPEPSHRPGEKELLYLSYARISIKTMARKST